MFFKDTKNNEILTKVAALLIHAAKIDENYSKKEKEIIKKTLLKIGATNEKIDSITAIKTINLVLQRAFLNLFSNFDILNVFLFRLR